MTSKASRVSLAAFSARERVSHRFAEYRPFDKGRILKEVHVPCAHANEQQSLLSSAQATHSSNVNMLGRRPWKQLGMREGDAPNLFHHVFTWVDIPGFVRERLVF